MPQSATAPTVHPVSDLYRHAALRGRSGGPRRVGTDLGLAHPRTSSQSARGSIANFASTSWRTAMLSRRARFLSTSLLAALVPLSVGTANVRADVITDWNEKMVAFVTPRMVPAAGQRVAAIVHVAMFDAVNSVERRYRPYLIQVAADAGASREAAAAAAAGNVLSGLYPQEAVLKDQLAV